METRLPEYVVDFSRKAFLTGKKYHERNNAELELFAHIKGVKKYSIEKKQRSIANGLEKMEAKISSLIEKEKKITSEHFLATDERDELKKRIAQLEKEIETDREAKIRYEQKIKEKSDASSSNEEYFKKKIETLELELAKERESKESISIKNKEQINSLSAMVAQVKKDFKEYLKKEGAEKEKRKRALKSLDARIIKNVD